VLHDPQKRQQYDQFGFNGPQPEDSVVLAAAVWIGTTFFSMFGEIFGGHSGGFGALEAWRRRWCSQKRFIAVAIAPEVKLSLHDVASGVTKKFKVRRT
jgi:molecular chaperone DnaJ